MSSRISRRAAGCEMPRIEGDTAARRVAPDGVFSLFAAYYNGSKLLHKAANSPFIMAPNYYIKPQIHPFLVSRSFGKLGCANAKAWFCLREKIILVHEILRKEFVKFP